MFYDHYKPFRNYVRKFPLIPSLVHFWLMSRHLQNNSPIPNDYPLGRLRVAPLTSLRELLHPWDLDILTREFILNASDQGTHSVGNYGNFATAINYVRRLDDKAFQSGGSASDAMFELHRVAHRTFKWQMDHGAAPMMRAYKIFGETAVNQVLQQRLGISMQQLMLMGMALCGNYMKQYGGNRTQEYAEFGISREASQEFYSRITVTLSDLRTETRAQQSYDQDWLYAWNPLELKPLVSIDPNYPERVICPIPQFLLWRIQGGIFFDLVSFSEFSNPFGSAFQTYIGDVIRATCHAPEFRLMGEQPYTIGSRLMHGIDWTLSDSTGHIFIEAKTKRLRNAAKFRTNTEDLEKDIGVMAKAIVQHYQNIRRALSGLTRWSLDGLPTYAWILTLENWYFLSPRVQDILKREVMRLLKENDVPENIIEELPYVIASAQEFEILAQIIAKIGISPVASPFITPERRGWALLPQATGLFPEVQNSLKGFLFEEEFKQLSKDMTPQQS